MFGPKMDTTAYDPCELPVLLTLAAAVCARLYSSSTLDLGLYDMLVAFSPLFILAVSSFFLRTSSASLMRP